MGMALPDLPQATDDRSPRGQFNSSAVDIGAWVPVLDAADDLAANTMLELLLSAISPRQDLCRLH